MTEIIAGLDIGNATSEVVLVDGDGRVVAADRAPTRGVKGSTESIAAAAALVSRTARRAGVEIGAVHVAKLRPVRTETLRVGQRTADTGPLRILSRAAATASGDGFACGTPWPADRDVRPGAGPGPHVVVVPARMPFREAVARTTGSPRRGSTLSGYASKPTRRCSSGRGCATRCRSSTVCRPGRRGPRGVSRSRCARPGMRCSG